MIQLENVSNRLRGAGAFDLRIPDDARKVLSETAIELDKLVSNISDAPQRDVAKL